MVGPRATESKELSKKFRWSCAGRPPGSNILSVLPGWGSVAATVFFPSVRTAWKPLSTRRL